MYGESTIPVDREEKGFLEKGVLRFLIILAFVMLVMSVHPVTVHAAANGFRKVNGNIYYYRNGKRCYGWQTISGSKYYFNSASGIMARGMFRTNTGSYYYFNPTTGAMMTGFLKNSNGQIRYFHSRTGIMATGFVKNSSGKYRYFDSKTGIMATGLVRNSNGLYRYFNPRNGIMETGWVVNKEGKYRYFSPKNGIMITGWHENTNGQKRYFDAKTGIMQTGWVKNSQGKYRYFSPNGGWMQTGMVTISGNRYYFDSNGLRMSGWITYNDNMYYFDPTTGIMAVSCWIDSTHYVGASGAYIPEYSSQDFRWPLDSQWNTLSSYFGNRTSPGGIGSTNHQGIDIPATLNTPVYAIADGIVTGKQTEAESGGAGNYLTISHGGTIVSEYMHLNRFAAIKVGDSVKKGQIIGYVGSTGNSTGPHLHLGIIINGTRRDPLDYVSIPE